MTHKEKLSPFLTFAAAAEWDATPEKWMYATDIVDAADISYDPQGALIDALVTYIESVFEAILAGVEWEKVEALEVG